MKLTQVLKMSLVAPVFIAMFLLLPGCEFGHHGDDHDRVFSHGEGHDGDHHDEHGDDHR